MADWASLVLENLTNAQPVITIYTINVINIITRISSTLHWIHMRLCVECIFHELALVAVRDMDIIIIIIIIIRIIIRKYNFKNVGNNNDNEQRMNDELYFQN